jgi:sugar phosphate permease
MRVLWKFRSLRAMILANTFYAASNYGINAFAPAFLMRVHHLSSTRTGLLMGVVYAVGGIIGTLGGGILADRMARRDEAWLLRIPALGQLLSVPAALAAWLVVDVELSAVFMTLAYMFGLLAFAPSFAAAQALVQDDMRATTSAVMLFFMTLIGASLGPLVVGWISDAIVVSQGALSLRYALSAMTVAATLSAILFYIASRPFSAELPRRA